MRLVRRDIDAKSGTGSVTLIPQEPEDMWHLYNLVQPSDYLTARALRKVISENDGTGAKIVENKRTKLTLSVLRTDFDPGAGELHVLGRNVVHNDYVPLGAHHTLDLELNRELTLQKGDQNGDGLGWDSVSLEQLKEALDVKKSAQVYAVIMQEGLANICLVTAHQTIFRQKVEVNVPRKRGGYTGDAHEKGMSKFFEAILNALLVHVDLEEKSKSEGSDSGDTPLLLASPGFTAAGFHKYMINEATRRGNKALQAYARDSVIVAHANSGHKHALTEVLRSQAVTQRLSDTKYARESELVEKFMQLVREDDGRAWYGPKEVERAVEKGAVGRGGGVLLISDKLFRSQQVQERKRWVSLVDRVRETEGGEVRVLSSSHESGNRIEQLGGLGAILTFPLEDLDLDDEEDEDGEEDA